ncbi:hypothetical protein BV898_04419 [Hypsibius exemplaris]|uniref:Uncharacterized protein n=1 Tax=Hypsibius exemplaris TaxID=2072580 RepID=A0A1W0X1Z4_HYPEX|nr:hypothetical protein BV898_04419 [Hypsibius exemplaris]
MDSIQRRSNFPTLLHPVEYYKYKKYFQPKLAPPRKKPANSFIQLSPAKFTEAFGLTISPPTISLGNSNSFTFCDGIWTVSHPKTKRHAARKSLTADRKDTTVEAPQRKCTPCRPRPRWEEICTSSPRPPKAASCFQDQEWELAQCRRGLREQYEKEKQEIEEMYRRKLQECERCHRELEETMRQEHEAKMNAQQSQVDALLIKCNELKGENNLLHIKVSKMMDMLAECAAEVNLQEAELAQVAQTLQQKKRCAPMEESSCCTETDEQEFV